MQVKALSIHQGQVIQLKGRQKKSNKVLFANKLWKKKLSDKFYFIPKEQRHTYIKTLAFRIYETPNSCKKQN